MGIYSNKVVVVSCNSKAEEEMVKVVGGIYSSREVVVI